MNMIVGQDRLSGYKDALDSGNMNVEKNLIVEGDFTEEGGFRAMLTLLASKPDAVFVASDTMAFGAMRAVLEQGLSIPDDVAVIGFDDLTASCHTSPTLTTVRQPIQSMGAMAADTIIELIHQPDASPIQRVIPTELIIRESSGSERLGYD
jgi:LacI family transcriptional regulator